jgi:hypothetical protein
MILLCIRLLTKAASPLRTTSKSLEIVFSTIPVLNDFRAPSCTTIKYWAAQVGYYKLKRVKSITDDWMVLIDASIQMGEKKCVVILGAPLASLCKINNRILTFEDLEVLSIHIVPTVNSLVINEMLIKVASVVGKISAICSDRGSDILCGVKYFQKISPETRHIADTAHRVSNFLEASLETDLRWKKFRELVTLARRKMQNSLIPGALPPSPRTKARYMNVDMLIKWAADMLVLLDQGVSNPGLDIDELRKYLEWLFCYRNDIEYWNRIIEIGKAARHVVRIEGIHMNIVDSFEQAISLMKIGARELQFANQLTEFLLSQSKGIKFGEWFIGSSEILESLFGKIKYMEREQRAFGFTSLLLAAMAAVGPLDEKIVAEAMESVKRSDIDKWAAEEIGQSVQAQRRQIKRIVANSAIKMINMKLGIDKWAVKEIGQIQSQHRQTKREITVLNIKIIETKKVEQKVSGIYEGKAA